LKETMLGAGLFCWSVERSRLLFELVRRFLGRRVGTHWITGFSVPRRSLAGVSRKTILNGGEASAARLALLTSACLLRVTGEDMMKVMPVKRIWSVILSYRQFNAAKFQVEIKIFLKTA